MMNGIVKFAISGPLPQPEPQRSSSHRLQRPSRAMDANLQVSPLPLFLCYTLFGLLLSGLS